MNNKTMIFLTIILLGIALSVYLVLNYQTILSRASDNVYNNVDVKDASGNPITKSTDCEGGCGPGDYDTQSPEVKFEIKDLEKLSE